MTPSDPASAPTSGHARGSLVKRVEARPEQALWIGDLTVTVECRPRPNRPNSNRHEITIHDDWSVTTPHDLEAERVGMAFGGYNSCVVLVDEVLPLLEPLLPRIARQSRPAFERDDHGNWSMATSESTVCCRRARRSFSSARIAFEHAVSASHLANRLGAPIWQIESIVHAVATASRPDFEQYLHLERRIREAGGIAQLWSAGIHPAEIEEMARWAAAVAEALPVSYFEAIAYSGRDPQWIPEVLKYRPDADTAAWLAWSPFEGVSEWAAWLGFGLSREEFRAAVEHMLPLSLVPEVASATGWSAGRSARMLVGWAQSGCSPTPSQLAELARLGADQYVPSRAAVDAAHADARRDGAVIERSEIGVMLALAGSRPRLLDAVRKGARTHTELVEYLEGR